MNLIRQNLEKYDLELLNEIDNILKFLKKIWYNNKTKTVEYLDQICLKFELYKNGLLENSTIIDYITSCYFFSNKLDMKRIKFPKKFKQNDINHFNSCLERLKECWNELGQKFSFKISLKNILDPKIQQQLQYRFINNTTLNLI